MNHHPHDIFFINEILESLPLHLQGSIKRTYSHTYDQQDRRTANLYLLDVKDKVAGKSLLCLSDSDLQKKAERLSLQASDIQDVDKAASYLASVGLPLPTADTEAGVLARLVCPIWWERALRKKQDKQQEQLAVQLGIIRKGSQVYCSTALLNRLQARHRRSLEIMEGMEAVSDDGDVLPMLDVLTKSMANPEVRRAELMVRMRGFEDYAKQQNHAAMFYTITCPSKYHRYSGDKLNSKYEDLTPKDGQVYLCDVWARIRAKLKREGLNVYGFRVAEPHHDGTPHWHMLLFVEAGQADALSEIIKSYALLEDGDESGAAEHRFKVEAIDERKGSATGYIAKYISKNVDGFGMDIDDDSGLKAEDAAQRVRAWSSVWGIRQFQQIGGAPVGVWRELRRLEQADDDLLEQARVAADSGDWCAYLQAQGGATTNRKAQPIRVYTVEAYDAESGEVLENRYGEFVPRVSGLSVDGVPTIQTRLKAWTIQAKADQQAVSNFADLHPEVTFDLMQSVMNTFGAEPEFLQAGASSLLPWSSVNNCTQPTGTARRAAL